MRRFITLLISLVFIVLACGAQDLQVKEPLHVSPFDIITSDMAVNDYNDVPCALVKVQLPIPGATFQGNIFKSEFKTNEYWLWMTHGTKKFRIRCPGFQTMEVDVLKTVPEGLKSNVCYAILLVAPTVTGTTNVDDGMRYLILNVTPSTATVFIDDQIRTVKNGSASVLLPRGVHSYRVEAAGYSPKSETVEIADSKVTVDVALESALAQLTVNCPTNGAKVYVNGNMMGTAPWSGQLDEGNYQIEAQLDGYRSQQQSVALAQKERRTIDLPALTAIVGALNVNYEPVNAEVWVDGKKLGTSPDVFRNIIVGSHSVEIRKSGYQTAKKTVTISDGETAQVSGQLVASPQPSQVGRGALTVSTGDSIIDNLVRNMVYVEGGTFTMGATPEQGKAARKDEKPKHKVTLSSFRIGKYEVTQEEWEAVMGSNPSKFKGDKLPVETVSWNDCQEFIRKLNEKTGMTFRLPTEAEWEYAARGGIKSRGLEYSGSKWASTVAWFDYDKEDKTHQIGAKSPNELGIYDMSGNVWEWCQDWYGEYRSRSQTNPTGPSSGSSRVFRGGGFTNGEMPFNNGSYWGHDWYCRVSLRYNNKPDYRIGSLGLRLAL